jgi:hypothetical protein
VNRNSGSRDTKPGDSLFCNYIDTAREILDSVIVFIFNLGISGLAKADNDRHTGPSLACPINPGALQIKAG